MTRRRPATPRHHVPPPPPPALVVPAFPGIEVAAWSDTPPAAYPPAVVDVIRAVLDARAGGTIPTVNGYRCGTCRGLITTVDRHPGVVPVYVDHHRFDRASLCPGLTKSLDYPRDLDQPPTAEWYRPSEDELLRLSDAFIGHVIRGGLLVRAVTP